MGTKKKLCVDDTKLGPTLILFVLAGFVNWCHIFSSTSSILPEYLNSVAPLSSSFISRVRGDKRGLLQLN